MPGFLIDPDTRDFVLDADGRPVVTSSPQPELLLALGVERGSCTGDPALGSLVPALVRRDSPPTTREIEAAARDGLRRLERAGTVSVDSVAYDPATRELTIVSRGLTFDVPIGGA